MRTGAACHDLPRLTPEDETNAYLAACVAPHSTTNLSLFLTLPESMQRSQVADLLLEVAPAIRLSAARLHALLAMIGYTRPQAWTDPEDEPVCYASQVELAAKLGLTPRAVRVHERALSRDLGLIEKRTAANGSRSHSGGLGLVFSQLIALVPQLLALAERRRVERSQVQSLVRTRGSMATARSQPSCVRHAGS